MSKATWDTGKAQRMWQAGYSDKDIAQEVGTTAASISYYRKKHWVDDTPPKEERQPEEYDANEATELGPAEQQDESEGVDRDEGPKVHNDRSEPKRRGSEVDCKVNRYEILAAATAGLDGIKAVCTAEAISVLLDWASADDLLKAKAAIEYMLQKMEAENGEV